MIEWPSTPLSALVLRNLEQLRASGAARELEDDARTYRFENFAWDAAFPLRFVLRDQDFRRVQVLLEDEGRWRIAPVAGSLATEASA